MDEIDLCLDEAWERWVRLCRERGEEWTRGQIAKWEKSRLGRKLRTWCLVIRAGDSRMGEGDAAIFDRPLNEGGGDRGIRGCDGQERHVVGVDRGVIERLCRPVRIDWPGVGVGEAARLFGVNAKTIWEWTKGEVEVDDGSLRRRGGGRLVRDEYVNRADRKRNAVRVWTRGKVMAGQVWGGPWGEHAAEAMVERVREDFWQRIVRERHVLTERCGQWRWVCPACERNALRLVWAMEPWTVLRAKGVSGLGAWRGGEEEGFRCVRCAGVVYESSERRWKKGVEGERVFWERWVGRMMGGRGTGYGVRGRGE